MTAVVINSLIRAIATIVPFVSVFFDSVELAL